MFRMINDHVLCFTPLHIYMFYFFLCVLENRHSQIPQVLTNTSKALCLQATKVVKEIQISLWGNIYVEEVYHLVSQGKRTPILYIAICSCMLDWSTASICTCTS